MVKKNEITVEGELTPAEFIYRRILKNYDLKSLKKDLENEAKKKVTIELSGEDTDSLTRIIDTHIDLFLHKKKGELTPKMRWSIHSAVKKRVWTKLKEI